MAELKTPIGWIVSRLVQVCHFAFRLVGFASPSMRRDVSHRAIAITKPCTVADCKGMMHFHDRRDTAKAAHTLEWPWYPTWVCAENSAHFELLTDAEYLEIGGGSSPGHSVLGLGRK
jgi:hypothetical protein